MFIEEEQAKRLAEHENLDDLKSERSSICTIEKCLYWKGSSGKKCLS